MPSETITYRVDADNAKPGDPFRLIDAPGKREAHRFAASSLKVRIATAKDGYEARERGIAIEDATATGDANNEDGGERSPDSPEQLDYSAGWFTAAADDLSPIQLVLPVIENGTEITITGEHNSRRKSVKTGASMAPPRTRHELAAIAYGLLRRYFDRVTTLTHTSQPLVMDDVGGAYP